MPEVKEFIVELTEERSAFVKVAARDEDKAMQYAREARRDGTIPPSAFSQVNHFESNTVTAKDLQENYDLEPEDAITCSLVGMHPLKERLARELFNELHNMCGIADHEDVVDAARAAVEAFATGRVNWDEGPGLDRTSTSNYQSRLDAKLNLPKIGM
jgi:hypothetical protein